VSYYVPLMMLFDSLLFSVYYESIVSTMYLLDVLCMYCLSCVSIVSTMYLLSVLCIYCWYYVLSIVFT
jgi:hypothetical protein